jgi:hypothetical protein
MHTEDLKRQSLRTFGKVFERFCALDLWCEGSILAFIKQTSCVTRGCGGHCDSLAEHSTWEQVRAMSQLANHLPVLKHNWSDGLGRALVALAGRAAKRRKGGSCVGLLMDTDTTPAPTAPADIRFRGRCLYRAGRYEETACLNLDCPIYSRG